MSGRDGPISSTIDKSTRTPATEPDEFNNILVRVYIKRYDALYADYARSAILHASGSVALLRVDRRASPDVNAFAMGAPHRIALAHAERFVELACREIRRDILRHYRPGLRPGTFKKKKRYENACISGDD